MKKLIFKFLNSRFKKIKGENFEIDQNISINSILNVTIEKKFQILRGLFYSLIFLKKTSLNLFLENKIKIRHGKLFNFGLGVYIKSGTIIDCLSIDGIKLGNGVTIGENSILRCTGSLTRIGKGIEIGDNSSLDAYAFIGGSGGVSIGKHVICGQKVSFHSENHSFDNPDKYIREQETTRKGITIEDNCWIGANVTILDGAYISSGSVVAAGAIVRGFFPKNSVIAGVPAKVVREIY